MVLGLTSIEVPGADDWTEAGLRDRTIALWPSHGAYFNHAQDMWMWQRATMWTTVEDVYTTEYMRLTARMLENAGAVVLQPRPRLGGRDLKCIAGRWVYRQDDDALLIGRSGLPRWSECAREWLAWAGYPDSIYSVFDHNHYKDDMVARGRWVNYLIGGSYLSPATMGLGIPVDACVALHTDGISTPGHETTVGPVAIYYTTGQTGRHTYADGRSRACSQVLAESVSSQLVHDVRMTHAPYFNDRGLRDANYAESRIPEVPTVLLELLSHKNMADMRLGLDPRFRFTAARALYKGLLRYLHHGGTEPVVQPLPVQDCRVSIIGTDSLCIQWAAQPDELEPTADPAYYILYMRADDGPWQAICIDDTTCYTYAARRGVRYDYYVLAANDGGVSFPSETFSAHLAYRSDGRQMPTILLINAFNHTGGPRWFCDSTYMGIVPGSYAVEDGMSVAYIGEQQVYDKHIDWHDDDNCGVGSCTREYAGTFVVGNTHDYTAQRGCVLARLGYNYVSCNLTALDTIDARYDMVEIIAGKQPTGIFTPRLRKQLTAYTQAGGRVLVSGSYIGASLTTPAERIWAKQTLHFRLRAPHATRSGSFVLNPTSGAAATSTQQAALPPHQLLTRPNAHQLFAEAPESLQPTGDAERLGLYTDSRIPCGTQYAHQTAVLGFPIECCHDWPELYTTLLNYLLQ